MIQDTHKYHHQGVLLALFAATGFASKAIFVKLAYAYGIDPLSLLAIRMLFAIGFFSFFSLVTYTRRPILPKLTQHDWLWVIALGFAGYYLASLLDFIGLVFISASLERLILMLGPTFTLLLSALLFRQRITRQLIIPLLMSYLGLGLILGKDISHPSGIDFLLGVGLVLSSTLCYSIYLTLSPIVIKRIGATRFSEIVTIVSGIIVLIHYFMMTAIVRIDWPWQVWTYGALMGVFSTVLPIYALAAGVARIGAARVALIGMIGPLLTILMGIGLLGEHLSTFQWVGAIFVIIGVWQVSRVER